MSDSDNNMMGSGSTHGAAGSGTSEQALGAPAKTVVNQAVDAAKDVAQTAKDQVSDLTDQATDAVSKKVEDHKGDVADQISEVAKVLQQSGKQLEGHQDWLAKLVGEGASELGGLAETLKTNDLHGLLGKLDDLARRQPAVFVGAAMAVGFAAVRVGKVAVAGASKADLPKMPEMTHEPS